MSIKLVLLKSDDLIISDAKEILKDDSIVGYLMKNPHKVSIQKEILLVENESFESKKREVNIVLSAWMPLSSDDEFVVSPDWVVCIMNPDKSVLGVYQEKVNE